MVLRCSNIQEHYNEAVIYLNFGTPKNNELTNGKFIILGVPILKHIRVDLHYAVLNCSQPRKKICNQSSVKKLR